MNHLMSTLYEVGLIEYTIKKMPTQDIVKDYYLRLFLVDNIDTNLISVFIPEILNSPQFVKRDARGKLVPLPC